jgi:tetratricopeptide (TPR) repeat protein
MSLHSPQLSALMDAAARAVDAGDDANAELLLHRIVAGNPRDADAWHMLAVIAVRNGRGAEAIDLAKRALELDRRNAAYLTTLGAAHAEAQHPDEALRCFKRALKERPAYAEAHYNLGKVYRRLDKISEAEECYLRARRLDPTKAEAAANLATLYVRQGRYDEALLLSAEANARVADDAAVVINAATALLARSGPQAAIRELALYLESRPDAAAVHAELGRLLLAEGRFDEGWRKYAWRHGRAPSDLPDYAGKRVLLLPDQGLGDHLFFLRFAAALRGRAAHVVFACPEKLFPLLQANSPVDELRRGAHEPAGFDLALPVGDLPRLLDSRDTPGPLAISVMPERLAKWRERLAALGPPPYLGVTWRAGARREDRSEFAARGEDPLSKRIEIGALAGAVRAWHGTVLIVQRLPREEEIAAFGKALGRVAHDLSRANDDLAEMAALLSLIEEYVAVSNTNVHLRAGLGKTARVLVPFPAEFRWMNAGDESPWFRGFRIYREPPGRDWRPVMNAVSADISK